MDQYALGKKTLNCQSRRSDRFVKDRASLDELHRRHSAPDEPEPTVDAWYSTTINRKRYASHLSSHMGLPPPRQRSKLWSMSPDYLQPWPCLSRRGGFLTSADSILDLPTYRYALLPELVDWNKDDVLVAALGFKYYKWSWRQQRVVARGVTTHATHACQFEPRGDLLLLGTDYKQLELHDHATSKRVATTACQCSADCFITCVDWSPTSCSFVTGCSNGYVSVFERGLVAVSSWRRVCRDAVMRVRVSPDARYVALRSVASSTVQVLYWPSLSDHSTIDTPWKVKSLSWHPWRAALLAVGGVTDDCRAALLICDAPTGKFRCDYTSPGHYNIDCMLFSHRTGELVLSLWRPGSPIHPNEEMGSRIVVLSQPDHVVDQWGGCLFLDRIRTMIFSPDGSKLATATLEEDLIIWNFLPEEDKKKSGQRRFHALPTFVDRSHFGTTYR